jgi:hypothetical protein
MKSHPTMISAAAGLLLAIALPAGLASAQQTAPLPATPEAAPVPAPTPAPAAPSHVDSFGNVVSPGAAPLALPPPALATACLQLHFQNALFNFNLTINPNTTPYTIVSGTVSGNLCQASTWHVTPGGSLGNALHIDAVRPPSGSCANKLTVVGNAIFPPSYQGSYGFNGSSNMFQPHHTLFLGFNRPSCP